MQTRRINFFMLLWQQGFFFFSFAILIWLDIIERTGNKVGEREGDGIAALEAIVADSRGKLLNLE